MLLLMTHYHCHEQRSSPAIIVNGLHLFGAYTLTRAHSKPIHTLMVEKLPCKARDLLSRSGSRFSVSLVSMLSGGAPSVDCGRPFTRKQRTDTQDVQCGG